MRKTGNTDLSELALSLYLLYGLDLGLKYDKLVSISKLVEQLSGVKMPPFKPVVGDNVFKRESGVTVMQLMSYPPSVESFEPELVGGKREIVLGKKSGKHSIEWKLKNLGINVPEDQIEPILSRVKALAEGKKDLVSDEEFKSIINEVRGR